MRKRSRFLITLTLAFCLIFFDVPSSNSAKTGSPCKKLNAKDWDGENPIVCKKNKSGKLVWTKFGAISSPISSNQLSISLIEIGETLPSVSEKAAWYCDNGGYRYPDISASTGIEIRDGNSGLLATGVLGSATVVDTPGSSLGNCAYKFVTSLKKSDFYQIKIGKRYDKSFSFADLASQNWTLTLYIGQ